MKKSSFLFGALLLAVCFTGCTLSQTPATSEPKEPVVLDIPGTDKPSNDENKTDLSALEDGWSVPDAGEYSASEGVLRKGNAVMYNGLILYRVYGVAAISTFGANGEFTFNDFPYDGSALYTFDPDKPDTAPKQICEDNGYGTLYLKGDDLYSSQAGDWGSEDIVYTRSLVNGKTSEICKGRLEDFAPGGEYFVTSFYESDTGYDLTYSVRSVSDPANPVYEVAAAHTAADGNVHFYHFLGMDDEHTYFALDVEDYEEYLLMQFNLDGSYSVLADLPFEDGSNPVFQDYFTRIDDKIEFSVYFYDGESGYYSGGQVISVPVAGKDQAVDGEMPPSVVMTLFEPERADLGGETDPTSLDYKLLRLYTKPVPENGHGFASFVQYYETFPQGRFYALSEAHRYPFGDFGMYSWYKHLQTRYMFLPEGFDTPIELNVTEEKNTSTVSAFVKFVGTAGDTPVGALYEIMEITSVEEPPTTDGHFYGAEFAPDFVYEYNSPDDPFSFTAGDMTNLTKDMAGNGYAFTSTYPSLSGKEGYEVSADYRIDTAVMMNIGFDNEGRICYMRPVVID